MAHPDHHRGQPGYVSLILYLTETKSIVSPSLVSCVTVVKTREKEGMLDRWEAYLKFHFVAREECFINLIKVIRKYKDVFF